MRAFITGLDGFAGQWLARELIAAGASVAGGSRNETPAYSILRADEAGGIPWHPVDITNGEGLASAFDATRPDVVFHLAAQASVGISLRDPVTAFDANATGTARVADAVARHASDAVLLYAGSAESYGSVAEDALPVRESQPLWPNNPYAAGKAAGEIAALRYAYADVLRVVATRSFNHIGPGQRTDFAASSFAAQVAEIARGTSPPLIRVGNLDAERDFTDVRDVVRAYRLLALHGKSGEAYNVCSGKAVSLREILDSLISIAGVDVKIEVDAARLRPVDTPRLVGDASKLRDATGWSPTISLRTSLEDLYAWHKERTKASIRGSTPT